MVRYGNFFVNSLAFIILYFKWLNMVGGRKHSHLVQLSVQDVLHNSLCSSNAREIYPAAQLAIIAILLDHLPVSTEQLVQKSYVSLCHNSE